MISGVSGVEIMLGAVRQLAGRRHGEQGHGRMLLVLLGLLALRLLAGLVLGVDLVGERHEDESNAGGLG